MGNQTVIKEKLTIEEVKIPAVEIVKTPKKVKKETVSVQKSKPTNPKPVCITISEKEFLNAMSKVKGEIRIISLYNAYNKQAKVFNGHVPSVVKTKIRAFGKKMVTAGKIKMVKGKKGFVYQLIKK